MLRSPCRQHSWDNICSQHRRSTSFEFLPFSLSRSQLKTSAINALILFFSTFSFRSNKKTLKTFAFKVYSVRETGLEPASTYVHMNLNHARLPIPPFPQESVGRGGFEPPKSVTADLQSAPFGHSGTYPYEVVLCNPENGAGDGTRTRNLLITNQLLCQ